MQTIALNTVIYLYDSMN